MYLSPGIVVMGGGMGGGGGGGGVRVGATSRMSLETILPSGPLPGMP